MSTLSVSELIHQIEVLKGTPLCYPSGKGLFVVTDVTRPEGPITFKRQKKGEFVDWRKIEEDTIPTNLLWRYVNALKKGTPTNIDRVVGASYNCRSVLEAIVAHLPHFYMCKPKRITEIDSDTVVVSNGHKCVIWNPEKEHAFKEIVVDKSVQGFINESALSDIYFDAQCGDDVNARQDGRENIVDENIRRVHSQMQVLLGKTADWMGLKTWIAVEDHGIVTGGKNILTYPHIISDLSTVECICNRKQVIDKAKHIDCIWFNGGMPFVFEVEHTTGVTSGLDRMNRLRESANMETNYVIVAPDADREMVLKKAHSSQYEEMNLWYLSYSSLLEMGRFAENHTYRGSSNARGNFVKMFMEKIGV